jgi:hypothetical protein
MKQDDVIDYATPCMEAERALKGVHSAMVNQSYEKAIEAALRAVAEVKLTLNAIKYEQEKRNVK